MIFTHTHPADILSDEFQRRKALNHQYSLRSFSRQLGLSSGNLSEILSKKQGISTRRAQSIAKSLKLKKREEEYFILLVQKNYARSKKERQRANERLLDFYRDSYGILHRDTIDMINRWFHFAMLEMTHLADFRSEPEWIASRLGISKEEVLQAAKRLVRLGLLEIKKNKWRQIKPNLETHPEESSDQSIRNIQSQLTQKALDAIEKQDVDKRCSTSVIISVDSKNIAQAHKLIQDFRYKFTKLMSHDSSNLNSVYCLSVHFFDLLND